MNRFAKRWSALMIMLVFVLLSSPVLGGTSKRGGKEARKPAASKAKMKARASATQTSTNPEVQQAQAFLTNGVARLSASLESES
jgi:hypothetical protein